MERSLESAGVEPLARHGILRDLEGQIAEMRAEEALSGEEILKTLDAPETFAEAYAGKPPEETPAPERRPPPEFNPNRGGVRYCLVALLAGAAIFIETATRLCAEHFFAPIPTLLHLAILSSTPLILLSTYCVTAWGGMTGYGRWLSRANGFLVAVSLAYTIRFAPLTPIAFIGLFYFGIGLLPFSPFIMLIAAICQGMRLCRLADSAGMGGMGKRWFAGFALAAVLLGGWAGYAALLDRAITDAVRSAQAERDAGIERIRFLRGEHYVLAQCFPRDFRTWGNEYASLPARRALYYRLTGKEYREAGTPFFYFVSGEDYEQGLGVVGATNTRLSLDSAVYDISIASGADGSDAGPGVAYAELTLEFANAGKFNSEA